MWFKICCLDYIYLCARLPKARDLNGAELPVKNSLFISTKNKISEFVSNRIRSNFICLDLIMRLVFFASFTLSLSPHSIYATVHPRVHCNYTVTYNNWMARLAQLILCTVRTPHSTSYIGRWMFDLWLSLGHICICLCMHEIGFNCSTKVMTEWLHRAPCTFGRFRNRVSIVFK